MNYVERTSRKERLFNTAVVATLGAGALFGISTFKDTDEPTCKPSQEVHTVSYGDTMWNIAQSIDPESADLREVVYELEEINQVEAKDLMPGQTLTLVECE